MPHVDTFSAWIQRNAHWLRDHSALPHFSSRSRLALYTGRGQESHSRLKRGESMDGKVKPVPLYGRRPSLDPQRDERRRRADGASRAARQPSRLSTSLLGRLLAADCSSVHRARSSVARPQAPPKMVCVQREAAARERETHGAFSHCTQAAIASRQRQQQTVQ